MSMILNINQVRVSGVNPYLRTNKYVLAYMASYCP